MFDYKHYVPVLRWKAAEKEALQKLGDIEKNSVTPLVEIIMPQPFTNKDGDRTKTAEEMLVESKAKFATKLPEIASELQKYWGLNPVFVDFNLVDHSLRVNSLETTIKKGSELKLKIIPVVCLSSDPSLHEVAFPYGKASNGVCLRLYRSDLNSETLSRDINTLLVKYGVGESVIDIVVDLQIADGQCLKISDIGQLIPNISKWRTFTVLSGTFPKDLMKYSVDLHFIDRLDWNCWLNQISTANLIRKPSFGDYTIQHPIFTVPTPGANPSASIRYTLSDKWMVMRGQGLRGVKSKGHAQYPALANLLMNRSEYKTYGPKFSFGDDYVVQVGSDVNNKNTGNPRTWLRAGINHHLACVISQIANLS